MSFAEKLDLCSPKTTAASEFSSINVLSWLNWIHARHDADVPQMLMFHGIQKKHLNYIYVQLRYETTATFEISFGLNVNRKSR